jgi:hypothetical protein
VASCLICDGPTSPRFAHCFACRTVAARLNLPLAPVLAAHLCPLTGPLYTVLMGYKESPVDEARRRFSGRVLRFFGDFFAGHGDCVTRAIGGGVDLVLPVPSSSRPGQAPLEGVAGLAELVGSGVGRVWLPTVLRRAGGPVGHMRPNATAFAVDPSARKAVAGARVLLLDDTYVSGSRAQSAAAALRLAGAGAVVIAPLGRVLRPDRVPAHATFLAGRPGEAGHRSRCVSVQTEAGSR